GRAAAVSVTWFARAVLPVSGSGWLARHLVPAVLRPRSWAAPALGARLSAVRGRAAPVWAVAGPLFSGLCEPPSAAADGAGEFGLAAGGLGRGAGLGAGAGFSADAG